MKRAGVPQGMVGILHALTVLSIYFAILTANPTVAGVALKKVLFALLLASYAVFAVRAGVRIPRPVVLFLCCAGIGVLALSEVSLFLGNLPPYVLAFLSPILYLLMIPVLLPLLPRYGLDRYLAHVEAATVLLGLAMAAVVILVAVVGYGPVLLFLRANQENLGLSAPEGSLRVIVKTGVFLPAGSFVAAARFRATHHPRHLLALAIVLYAAYLTKSLGIWGGLGVAAAYLSLSQAEDLRQLLQRLAVAGIVAAGLVVATPYVVMVVGSSKTVSFSYKTEQARNALAQFAERPVFGNGMGHLYRNLDARRSVDPFIEVAPVMALASGGLVGTAFYAALYLGWLVPYARLRRKTPLLRIVFASYVAVLLASLGNPHVWSGATGLFFLGFLVAGMLTRGPLATADPGVAPSPALVRETPA